MPLTLEQLQQERETLTHVLQANRQQQEQHEARLRALREGAADASAQIQLLDRLIAQAE